jgi:replicative DNA helicase
MFKSSGTIDPKIERRVMTCLIVSDRIASELIPIIHKELFKTNINKVIFTWLKEYHATYGKAVGVHIQDIFISQKAHLDPTTRIEIEDYLSTLSKEFESSELINEDYLLMESKKYLNTQHLLYMSDQVRFYAESGLIEEATASIDKYGSMVNSGLTNWRSPMIKGKFMESVFNRTDDEPLFSMGGALDTLFGPLKRSWLMLLLGPMKRGKSFALQEISMCALLNGKNVAFLSLEMDDRDIALRFYKGLTSSPDVDKDVTYPIFDCVLNQRNSCNDPRRINKTPRPPTYTPNNPYKTCTLCRGAKAFIPTVWYFTQHRKGTTHKSTVKRLADLDVHIQPNLLRLQSYTIGTANIQMIDQNLKIIELTTGWIPDVIVIDYADILAPEQAGLEGRDKENSTWKALKALSQSRKALVVTATQGNRASFDTESLDEKNTSEDIRKLAHIDIAATINQTEQEKIEGVARIAILNHRWKTFHKSHQAMILQQLETSQFHLDSTIIIKTKDKKLKRS